MPARAAVQAATCLWAVTRAQASPEQSSRQAGAQCASQQSGKSAQAGGRYETRNTRVYWGC